MAEPRRAIAAVVLLAFALWGLLAYEASIPHFFLDELMYMKSGVSLAQGTGLGYQGEGWGYGPVFPALVAALTKLTPGQESTYIAVKLVNALAFSLAAVPVYLLARRLLTRRASVFTAAAAVAIPSVSYVSVVMTESVSYLLALVAMLATVRALELPAPRRQLVAIAAVGAAVATRPQLVVLFVAYVVALAAVVAVETPRPGLRQGIVRLAPTLAALLLGALWLLRPVLEGRPFGDALGSYSVLARSYRPFGIAAWFVHHVGDLALYLGIVPMVVAPVVLLACLRRARAGSVPDRSFLTLFVAQNVVGIGLVAAFASTTYGLGLLYDRYLFYVIPLWLIVFARWLQDGLPRSPVPLTAGGLTALVAVGTLPFGAVSTDDWFAQFEAVATEVWGKVGNVAARLPYDSPRLIAILFTFALVAAVAFLPRRLGWALVAAVALVMGANLTLSWRSAFVSAADFGVVRGADRSWVDERVGESAHVTVVYVSRACKRHPEASSERLTSFFNRSVRSLRIRPGGQVVFASGRPLTAAFLVTQPGITLAGRRIAESMPTRLQLWDVHGPVRITNPSTPRGLWASRCAA